MLWSIDSYQNRASADQYHLTVPRAQVSIHRGRYFFEVIRWQITSFKWSQVYFFQGLISNMLCLCHYGPALLGFWFQTDLRSNNSASFFKSTGGEDLTLPWSRVGHALRPILILWLVKIWQVSSCGKIMQHLESCLLCLLCLLYSVLLKIYALHVQYGIQAFAKFQRPECARLHLRELQSQKFSLGSIRTKLSIKVPRLQSWWALSRPYCIATLVYYTSRPHLSQNPPSAAVNICWAWCSKLYFISLQL